MKTLRLLAIALLLLGWAGCSPKSAEPKVAPPVLGSVAVTDVKPTTAKASSLLKDVGAAGSVSEFGLCYGLKDSPTTTDTKVKLGTTAANPQDFSASLTGLSTATTYFIRSYAVYAGGTAYGDQASFTTGALQGPSILTGDANAVSRTTFSIAGDLRDVGSSDVTQYGHVMSENNQLPTLADNKTEMGGANVPKVYNSTYTNLRTNTTYYVRAYATNAAAGTSYGAMKTVKTGSDEPPVVQTQSLWTNGNTNARFIGSVVSAGTQPVTQHGHVWSSGNQSPTTNDSKSEYGTSTAPRDYMSLLPELTPNTTYYVRAYATNAGGTSYGEIKTVKTLDVKPLTVETRDIKDITSKTAYLTGMVTGQSGPKFVTMGFYYSSVNPRPNEDDAKISTDNYNTPIYFFNVISNLKPNTTYSVRSFTYSTTFGTGYGDIKSFKTLP